MKCCSLLQRDNNLSATGTPEPCTVPSPCLAAPPGALGTLPAVLQLLKRVLLPPALGKEEWTMSGTASKASKSSALLLAVCPV